MPENITISPARPAHISLDFQELRRQGLQRIEKLGSRIWTDYNIHDPGITLLEALCYALTDLGYRTSFPVEDLLTPREENPRRPDDFHPPALSLSTNPVTPEDLRKILIDTVVELEPGRPGKPIKNAWFRKWDQSTAPPGMPWLRFENVCRFSAAVRDKISALLAQLEEQVQACFDKENLAEGALLTRAELIAHLNRCGMTDATAQGLIAGRLAVEQCVFPKYKFIPPQFVVPDNPEKPPRITSPAVTLPGTSLTGAAVIRPANLISTAAGRPVTASLILPGTIKPGIIAPGIAVLPPELQTHPLYASLAGMVAKIRDIGQARVITRDRFREKVKSTFPLYPEIELLVRLVFPNPQVNAVPLVKSTLDEIHDKLSGLLDTLKTIGRNPPEYLLDKEALGAWLTENGIEPSFKEYILEFCRYYQPPPTLIPLVSRQSSVWFTNEWKCLLAKHRQYDPGHPVRAYFLTFLQECGLDPEAPMENQEQTNGEGYWKKVYGKKICKVTRALNLPGLLEGLNLDEAEELPYPEFSEKLSAALSDNAIPELLYILLRAFAIYRVTPQPFAGFTSRTIRYNGLYQIYLELRDDIDPLRTDHVLAIRRAALEQLHRRRGLSEDFADIRIVDIREICLNATIEVRPEANRENVLAEVFFRLQRFLTPPVDAYSLEEMLDRLAVFRLTPANLESLPAEGVPAAVVEALASLKNREFKGREAFLTAIRQAVADPLAAREYENTIVRQTDVTRDLGEIFNGPLLENGFIDSAELERAILREAVYKSDLYQVIMDVEGVIGVPRLVITTRDTLDENGGDWRLIDDEWCLKVSPNRGKICKPVLRVDCSDVLFRVGVLLTKADAGATRERLALLRELSKRPLLPFHPDTDIPRGRARDLETYPSVQEELPVTYGVGAAGLPPLAPPVRQAQARQLQGYLLFFDQILANYLAQLAHVRELLSTNQDPEQSTYFYQTLANVPGIADLIDQYGIYRLNDRILDALEKKGLPAATLDRLRTLRDSPANREGFAGRELFLETIRLVLGAEVAGQHEDMIRQVAGKQPAFRLDPAFPDLLARDEAPAAVTTAFRQFLARDFPDPDDLLQTATSTFGQSFLDAFREPLLKTAEKQDVYRIDAPLLDFLREQGAPAAVVERVAARQGEEITGENAFLAVLREIFGDYYASLYGETILDRARRTVYFQINEAVMDFLETESIPADVVNLLRPLAGERFGEAQALLDRLAGAFGDAFLQAFGRQLVDRADSRPVWRIGPAIFALLEEAGVLAEVRERLAAIPPADYPDEEALLAPIRTAFGEAYIAHYAATILEKVPPVTRYQLNDAVLAYMSREGLDDESLQPLRDQMNAAAEFEGQEAFLDLFYSVVGPWYADQYRDELLDLARTTSVYRIKTPLVNFLKRKKVTEAALTELGQSGARDFSGEADLLAAIRTALITGYATATEGQLPALAGELPRYQLAEPVFTFLHDREVPEEIVMQLQTETDEQIFRGTEALLAVLPPLLGEETVAALQAELLPLALLDTLYIPGSDMLARLTELEIDPAILALVAQLAEQDVSTPGELADRVLSTIADAYLDSYREDILQKAFRYALFQVNPEVLAFLADSELPAGITARFAALREQKPQRETTFLKAIQTAFAAGWLDRHGAALEAGATITQVFRVNEELLQYQEGEGPAADLFGRLRSLEDIEYPGAEELLEAIGEVFADELTGQFRESLLEQAEQVAFYQVSPELLASLTELGLPDPLLGPLRQLPPASWEGKTAFLDALDQALAGGLATACGDNLLARADQITEYHLTDAVLHFLRGENLPAKVIDEFRKRTGIAFEGEESFRSAQADAFGDGFVAHFKTDWTKRALDNTIYRINQAVLDFLRTEAVATEVTDRLEALAGEPFRGADAFLERLGQEAALGYGERYRGALGQNTLPVTLYALNDAVLERLEREEIDAVTLRECRQLVGIKLRGEAALLRALQLAFGARPLAEHRAILEERGHHYSDRLKEILEPGTAYIRRKNRFLDHLLARFGETFSDYAAMAFHHAMLQRTEFSSANISEKILADKALYLREIPLLTAERGKGFNYRRLDDCGDPDVWNSENVAGLKRRICRRFGIRDIRRRRLTCTPEFRWITYPDMLEGRVESFRYRLEDRSGEPLFEGTEVFKLDANARPRARLLYEMAMDEKRYVVYDSRQKTYLTCPPEANAGGEAAVYQLCLTDPHQHVIGRTGFLTWDEACRRKAAILNLAYPEDCREEGFHIVEHILLRPVEPDYALLQPFEIAPGVYAEDPFSFWISVIAPEWLPQFRDGSLRDLFREAVREETPAHIGVRFLWLNNTDMYRFETAYRKWLEELARPEPDERNLTAGANDLINWLNSVRFQDAEALI